MNEPQAKQAGMSAEQLEKAAGVPLALFTLHFTGRSWRIWAARDHGSLLEAADHFVALPFGMLLWESATVLATVLAEEPEKVAGRSVLEVGAGAGLPGIVARGIGAARVRQTDHLSETLTLCRANAEENGVEGIELALANWDAWTDSGQYDVIIASDVIYERSAHASLAAILQRNLAPGGRVMLADPGRQDTPLFLADLTATGWQSEQRRRSVPSLMPGGAETVGVDIIELWK